MLVLLYYISKNKIKIRTLILSFNRWTLEARACFENSEFSRVVEIEYRRTIGCSTSTGLGSKPATSQFHIFLCSAINHSTTNFVLYLFFFALPLFLSACVFISFLFSISFPSNNLIHETISFNRCVFALVNYKLVPLCFNNRLSNPWSHKNKLISLFCVG